jgi:hypothetical protein
MPTPSTVISRISGHLSGVSGAAASECAEWVARHESALAWIERNLLPYGGSIQPQCTVMTGESSPERVVIDVPWHHMNEHGGYDGWTSYRVIVTPSLLHGISIRITGRDRDDVKGYLLDIFGTTLLAPFPEDDAALADYRSRWREE